MKLQFFTIIFEFTRYSEYIYSVQMLLLQTNRFDKIV